MEFVCILVKYQDHESMTAITSIELLPLEAMFLKGNVTPVSTLTWMKGDYTKVEGILKKRLQQIVFKNPWLQGRIKKGEAGGWFGWACIDGYKVIALNVERKQSFQRDLDDFTGMEQSVSITSRAFCLRAIRGIIGFALLKCKLEYKYALLDNDKLQKAKIEAASEGNVPFISTNDVITSWFFNQAQSASGGMAVNYRNKLNGYTDLDVGNYENHIYYRQEDYANPALIRKSLSNNYRRVVTGNKKPPGFHRVMLEDEATVSNWSSFAKPFDIQDCEQELHVPTFLKDISPTSIPFLYIFRASKDKMGLLYLKVGEVNHLENCPFLDQKI